MSFFRRYPIKNFYRHYVIKNKWITTAFIAVCVMIGAGVVAGFITYFGNHEVRAMALEKVLGHPRTAAVLGRPIESNWVTLGTVKFTGGDGTAELSFGVSGRRWEGTVHT